MFGIGGTIDTNEEEEDLLGSAKYDTGRKVEIFSNTEQLSLLSQIFHLTLL